jgi:hypothetical protein
MTRLQYYWFDPDTNAALYHATAYNDEANPFFEDAEDAERFLQQQAEAVDEATKERYHRLSLYAASVRKQEDAVEVLMEQAGLTDFDVETDGGLQIENPQPEPVYFWYDPTADYILQEEIEPYDVRGVFETEDDAHRFLAWYADQYDVEDASHMELYRAEIQHVGTRPNLSGWSVRTFGRAAASGSNGVPVQTGRSARWPMMRGNESNDGVEQLGFDEDDQTGVLGGSIGGLHRDDVPRVVSNLLNDRGRGVEIRTRPESLPDDHHYAVEW